MSKIKGKTLSGSFTIEAREILGNLTEAGEKTHLNLHDPEFFNISRDPETCIQGKLHNLIKVSLLDCICPGTGWQGMGEERMSTARVFPHYVISGTTHIGPHDKVITEIDFCINDATALFYDFDAFGSVIHGEKFIKEIANGGRDGNRVATGPHPKIFYFTGVYEMARIETALGTFTARHAPSYNFPGPWGFNFKNTIVTALEFAEPVTFNIALQRLIDLKRYLSLLVGRPQNITNIVLTVPEEGEEHPNRLDVDWSLLRSVDDSEESRSPNPRDVLVDPIGDKTGFAAMTTAYFSRQDAWRTPRGRFYTNFEKHRFYSVDRLIGAANMFDILPSEIFGPPPTLSPELLTAQQTARDAFRPLAHSPDRASVLGALSRLGTWSLKKKIASRLDKFLPKVADRFPELAMVTEKAVNARNFYVHGGEREFDYDEWDRTRNFFVDALEFVFAASDLAEAGWNPRTWMNHSSISHRFGGFVYEYEQDLKQLKMALVGNKASQD
jgi:hypothetical protein